MLSKKTAIGIGIGSLAVALGVYFLLQSFSNLHDVNDTVDIGKSDVFEFDAQNHYHELLNVTGASFHVKLKTPSNGLQVDNDFENKVSFDWVSLADGKHFINITNTGGSPLHVTGKLEAVQNPMIFMSHLIVISSGILIIGISAAFSVRKPRGF
ncbi:MAG: hypothetical protein ABI340_06185 [Nitrososphaera sp.]|jgi:hypothetical protein